MNRGDGFDGLEFDDYLARYKKVEAIPTLKFEISIDERDGFLTLKWDVAEGEFAGETFFVDGFE
jgi:hypothetical protein